MGDLEETSRIKRVLVVDDDEDSVELLQAALDMNGYVTRGARDGPAAVAAAKEFAPDIALVDIGLPEMDGYEVAAALRALPSSSALLLVAVTGYNDVSDRNHARESGFDHHVVKPVQLQRLLELLASPDTGT